MIEKIKDGLTIVIICIILFGGYKAYDNFFGKDDPKKVIVDITPLPTVVPTDEEKAIVPEGHKAIGTLKPVVDPKSNRWEKKELAVVISSPADGSCNTCTSFTQLEKTKTFVGFSFEPKFYVGFTNNEVTLGYDQGLFRWGRSTVDALITFQYAGIGLGYNLTNNLSVLVGGNVQYFQYSDIGDLSTYSFDPNKLTVVRPVIAGTFNFN